MKKTYRYYVDAGHGWMAVPRKELKLLGIADKISPYSYEKGQTVYLEEDCDMSIFLEIAKEKGWQVDYETIHHNDKVGQSGYSPIRNYGRYNRVQ